MKAIIYCRKSTDRSDRQQLSISSQESEARKIAEREWLEVVEVFKETMSAKSPWRPLFNKMMALFGKWKADCIITWKLNRVARNPVDEWTIKWSIQNGIIQAIYTEWEVFKTWDNVLIMWMHFWMSTQYILDLQKDIKRGMKRKREEWGVCYKAPIGYINNRLEKTVEVDPIKSEWVKEVFKLRTSKMSYSSISKRLYEKWITGSNWKPFATTTLDNMVQNKFYIGLTKSKWQYYKGKYKAFIDEKLYNEANNIFHWLYEWKATWIDFPFKWIVKDNKWLALNAYTTKWHKYYKSQTKSPVTVNISETKLDNKIWEVLKDYEMRNEFKELNKKMGFKLLEKWKPEEQEKMKFIKSEIKKLKQKKESLLDLRLEWEIDKKIYNEKLNNITFKINTLENDKKDIWSRKDEKKIIKGVELACSLYNTYKEGSREFKSDYLRENRVELLLDTKKELSLAENSYLKLAKFLNFQIGGANEARTRVYGVADRCITTLPWHQKFCN